MQRIEWNQQLYIQAFLVAGERVEGKRREKKW